MYKIPFKPRENLEEMLTKVEKHQRSHGKLNRYEDGDKWGNQFYLTNFKPLVKLLKMFQPWHNS